MTIKTIKTIADFKRAMTPGSKWSSTHKYIGKKPTNIRYIGVRECGLNNTVNFGFLNPNSGNISHCSWPKKAEFRVVNNVVVITVPDFVQLTYRQEHDDRKAKPANVEIILNS